MMRSSSHYTIQRVTLDVPDAGLLRVLIVADDPLARTGLASILTGQSSYAVAESATANEALFTAINAFQPDVVLWDVGFAASPVTELAQLEDVGLPVVVLLSDETFVPDAWAAGARALLFRDAAPAAIASALVAVQQGLVVLDPILAESLLALPETTLAATDLTSREQEVLGCMAEGLPNKLIADRLQISENTVKFHIGSILSKLGVHSRTEAVIHAARRGLLML